jgi:hypothetical protein
MMLRLVIALLLCLVATSVEAATCFWVSGTGTWDNSTDAAHWKSTSGGGTACAATGGVPKNAGDVATFDGSSGGGTVTNNVDLNIGEIIAGAFTGTLDWATNNKNVTVSAATGISFTGAGTRTINLGNGTWTLTGLGSTTWNMATVTGLTFNANSSTIVFAPSGVGSQTFDFGAKAVNVVTLSARTGASNVKDSTASHTIATLNIAAPNIFQVSNGATLTITNAFNWVGTSSQPIYLVTSNVAGGVSTIASGVAGTCTWCAIRTITFTGAGSFTANNSFNLQNNTNISFNGPAAFGGSGGCILGGWLLWRDMPEHLNDNFPAWLEKVI